MSDIYQDDLDLNEEPGGILPNLVLRIIDLQTIVDELEVCMDELDEDHTREGKNKYKSVNNRWWDLRKEMADTRALIERVLENEETAYEITMTPNDFLKWMTAWTFDYIAYPHKVGRLIGVVTPAEWKGSLNFLVSD
jgi:hypothetical protein